MILEVDLIKFQVTAGGTAPFSVIHLAVMKTESRGNFFGRQRNFCDSTVNWHDFALFVLLTKGSILSFHPFSQFFFGGGG
jgi:hypothetical protein